MNEYAQIERWKSMQASLKEARDLLGSAAEACAQTWDASSFVKRDTDAMAAGVQTALDHTLDALVVLNQLRKDTAPA